VSKDPGAAAGMSRAEARSAASMAGIYALRMLGLFMILPVFALYAEELEGTTPALAGVAIGIYGMTQAILQIPYGLLSDRIGRKPVIIFGLLVFALGSVIAANADSIYLVIVGRAIQGAGAIAAAVMALTADLIREEHRVKAMAIIGMSIGASFALAMVLGPVLNTWVGVPGIFWLTAVLAVVGIGVVVLLVPNPVVTRVRRDAEAVPRYRYFFATPDSYSELRGAAAGIARYCGTGCKPSLGSLSAGAAAVIADGDPLYSASGETPAHEAGFRGCDCGYSAG
jgi:MFS family permease